MDAAPLALAPPQRARGRLDLAFRRDPATSATRIARFYQEGCLKARLPRPAAPGLCEAISINISGGVAGGDRLRSEVELRAGAALCLSSQSAERVYRAGDGIAARIETRLQLAEGARLDYLPQATILFDGFALDRALEISMTASARLLAMESLVFGRQAMGEAVRHGCLRDRISLHRDGRLLLQDTSRLEGEICRQLARPALAAGSIAIASLIYAAPDSAARLPAIRAALASAPGEAGASAFDGLIFVRMLAPEGAALRRCQAAVIAACRAESLPRTWQG